MHSLLISKNYEIRMPKHIIFLSIISCIYAFDENNNIDLKIKLYTRFFVLAILFFPFSYFLIHLYYDEHNIIQRMSAPSIHTSIFNKKNRKIIEISYMIRDFIIKSVSSRLNSAFCSNSGSIIINISIIIIRIIIMLIIVYF